jgi:hypothetical protein
MSFLATLKMPIQVRTRSMVARTSRSPTPTPHRTSEADPMEEEPGASPSGGGRGGGGELADNVDVLVCRADWLHYLGAYQA